MQAHTVRPRPPRAGRGARDAEVRAWVEARLGAPGLTLEPASEDASFRRYLRARAHGRTFVVMDAPPEHEDCRPFVHVARLLREAGLAAPAVHAADLERGLLLLDDLGPRCYLDVLDAASADALYAEATAAVLEMQARVPAAAVPPYDRARVEAETSLFPEWFLARHLGVEPEGALGAALAETSDALCAAFAEQPVAFVHRDYHSRNLVPLAADGPGILDFQDAVAGPVTYDLVSLLRDVYVAWPRARVEAWVRTHHARAAARGLGGDADADAFLRWFDLTGVQRHIKVAGIFCRLWYRDGKSRYLADLPLTLAYLLEVGARHPETERLTALLVEHDVARRAAARG